MEQSSHVARLNGMRRWIKPLLAGVAVNLFAIYLAPFRAVVIELQPDGSNLGILPAWLIRAAWGTVGFMPLLILTGVLLSSVGIRQMARTWMTVGLTSFVGACFIVWGSFHFRT